MTTNTSYLFSPRWDEMAHDGRNLYDMIPWLEERDRKLEDFLSVISVTPTGGVVALSGSSLFAVTDGSELDTGSWWAINYAKAITWYETATSTEPFGQLFTASLGADKHFQVAAYQGAALELVAVNAAETDSVYIQINDGQTTYYNGGKHFFQSGTYGIIEIDPTYINLAVEGASITLNPTPQATLAFNSGTDLELVFNTLFFGTYTDADKVYYDNGTNKVTFEAGTGFYFASPTQFLYTVDALFNVKTAARAGLTAVENSVVASDGSWAAVTIHDSGGGTATVLHHDSTNNQLDVFAYDQSTYRPIKASAFTVSSSRATKTDIRPYTDAPVLSPVRYVRDGKEQVGFIAEEVQAMFPEASDGTGVDLMPVVASLMERVNRLERGT